MYKVKRSRNPIWQVYTIVRNDEEAYEIEIHYEGLLLDCEAWIRLTEDGRI